MKKALSALTVITITVLATLQLTSAFFSDTETSTNNSFVAGAIDLLINGGNDTQGLVNIQDLKPGDEYYIDKTLFVDSNPAYVWLHIKDLVASQSAQTEPEILEESQNGEKFDIQNYMTYDLTIDRGDTREILVDFNDENLLPEMVSCWIPLGEIPGGTNVTLTQSFHFDETVTNWAQGDSLVFTEEYYAEQVRNNPNPVPPSTGSGRVWNPDLRHCQDCTPGQAYASSVISAAQGNKKNGSSVDANRSNSANALGAPDTVNVNDPKWYTLGFGGQLVLKFTFPISDVSGDDLLFHEITGGRNSYPLEKATVEVSDDGVSWEPAGEVTSEPGGDGVVGIDFSSTSFSEISYVRITDTTDAALHIGTADGYDLDAVEAVSALCTQQ